MKDLTIVIPADVAAALRLPTEGLGRTLCRELAVHLYQHGLLGVGPARRLAQMDKLTFHQLLGDRGVIRHYDEDEWEIDHQNLTALQK